MLVGGQDAAFATPFDGGCRFATKPYIIANRSAFFQGDVMYSISNDVRWHCKSFETIVDKISWVQTKKVDDQKTLHDKD